MENKLTVSIIVPIYNVERYVGRCLKSIMSQTYPNIECLLVNDETPDSSISVCEKLISEYNGQIKFHIIHHPQNKGVSSARNTGIQNATGDYIYFIDSDDELVCHSIELLINEIYHHPNSDVVLGKVDTVPTTTNYHYPCFNEYNYITDNNWVRLNFFRNPSNFPVIVNNKLIKLNFLKQHNLYFKEGIIHEDELWSFLLCQKLSTLVIIPNSTYIRHYRPNSIMTGTNNYIRGANYMEVLRNIIKSIDEPYFDLQLYKYIDYFLSWYCFVPKSDYRDVSKQLSKLLLKSGSFLLGILFFLHFNVKGGKRFKNVLPYIKNSIQKKHQQLHNNLY